MEMFRLVRQWLLPLKSMTSKSNCAAVDLDKCYAQMNQLVDKAAKLMKEASTKMRLYDTKGNNTADLVTATDREVEQLLIKGLKEHFPNHVYIGEEGTGGAATGRKLTDAPTWIIDPIDGTTNFVHGLHYTCISVGFWLNKQPELAICCNPMIGQKFTARRNCGAYMNGVQIEASGQTDLEKSIILNELNSANFEPELMAIQMGNSQKMLEKAHALRTTGSAAMDLCLVAMGAADGYYEFYPHCWDTAAGVLLVREAGGVVIDPAGGEFDVMGRRVLAAATPQLGEQMVKLLGDMQIYHARDDEPAPTN
ncbi:inositol monophosphatase 1-like [Drosophila sulfurigaster albostrigata]|uniref:inositol monophosphatase 1-like n=1 Tax=Drosophila sulfurigaster albostrigata TaxID=89887 RepID=UPI002D21D1B5|nr:inositol monophosphatase 1-like [Drosophila sulfurigaster albostrigata]